MTSLLSSIVKKKYDIFVVPNRITDISAWVSLFAAKIIGRRVCLWGHGFRKKEPRWSAVLRKLMMKLACANILYSENGRNQALSMGIAPENLFIAYNALDTNRSENIRQAISIEDLDQFREMHCLKGRQIVIFTGRLQSRKKPHILAKAMEYVAKMNPNALALFIGEGEMRGEIERIINDLKINNHVRLLGAVFDEKILARYFMCSSIAVMPAHAGLFIQHAFDYGVPIIVGDDMKEHPPEIELVKNGETGIFCEDGNPNEFAEAILGLLRDTKKQQRMSVACRRIIEDRYNVETMANGFLQAFHWAHSQNKH